jgi:hypothetical protein
MLLRQPTGQVMTTRVKSQLTKQKSAFGVSTPKAVKLQITGACLP